MRVDLIWSEQSMAKCSENDNEKVPERSSQHRTARMASKDYDGTVVIGALFILLPIGLWEFYFWSLFC